MLGTHNYDILKNQFYQEAFQYIPIKLPHGVKDRKNLIEDGGEDNSNNLY